MGYDKNELERFCEMEDWGTYLEREGALANNVSKEGFKFIEQKYFRGLNKRINYCKKLLQTNDDSFINYVLAQLYDRANLDESTENLYKRKVRFFCIRAIRKDRRCAEAWALLAHAYSWVAFLGGNENNIPKLDVSVGENIVASLGQQNFLINGVEKDKSIRYLKKAIYCAGMAVKLEPQNKKYQKMLKDYYCQRNEEYKRKIV